MDRIDIDEKIRYAKSKRYLTNCYSGEVVKNANNLWKKGDDFIFSYDDHGINRLIYFVKSWKTMDSLIDQIEDGIFYLEFITKEPSEYIPKDMVQIARMMRYANPDVRNIFIKDKPVLRYKEPYMGKIATVKETDEINRILWRIFRTEISHLLYNTELEQKIADGAIIINRNNHGNIDALLQVDIKVKKFYINQVLNRGEPQIIHSILLKKLEDYISNGGKYIYAWIEENNIASIKFHQKYEMKHDGMWSMIYCLEK